MCTLIKNLVPLLPSPNATFEKRSFKIQKIKNKVLYSLIKKLFAGVACL
jgi:hypothetical protein